MGNVSENIRINFLALENENELIKWIVNDTDANGGILFESVSQNLIYLGFFLNISKIISERTLIENSNKIN